MLSQDLTACFIGHRKVENSDFIKSEIFAVMEKLIASGVTTFLFGSKSEFDDLCREQAALLKKRYSFLKRVYVRAEYELISDSYLSYLLQEVDETFYPDNVKNSKQGVYVKRNQYMIDRSDFCVFYFNPQTNSGVKTAYTFAQKRKKQLINVFWKCSLQISCFFVFFLNFKILSLFL